MICELTLCQDPESAILMPDLDLARARMRLLAPAGHHSALMSPSTVFRPQMVQAPLRVTQPLTVSNASPSGLAHFIFGQATNASRNIVENPAHRKMNTGSHT